jgi:D-aminopeptidase
MLALAGPAKDDTARRIEQIFKRGKMIGKFSALVMLLLSAHALGQESRPRARDLGIAPGIYRPGPMNAITDITGVKVGHVTLIEGTDVRTGVTAILPHDRNVFQNKVPAAVYLANAFGKLTGSTQIEELGNLETPIVLTNTLSVGTAMEGVLDYILGLPGNEGVRSVNAVVGETNDGGLNDIRARVVTRQHVLQAIAAASYGAVREGAVGAGTGTQCLGYKGGIGTSSREVPVGQENYRVGVLVQTNYGGHLAIDGIPVAKEWRETLESKPLGSPEEGSCMIIVATDAPMASRNLGRLAKRAILGISQTGSYIANGSGDFVIAFSVHTTMRIPHSGPQRLVGAPELSNDSISPLFQAAKEATEEAVYNALLQAVSMEGYRGNKAEALPLERLKALLRKYGRSG